MNLSKLLKKYARRASWPSTPAMNKGLGIPPSVTGTMRCQDADRNVENNLNKGTFKGVRCYVAIGLAQG